MTLVRRFWTYQAERFPLKKTVPLLAVFSAASISVSASLADRPLPGFGAFAAGFVVALSLFFQMRVCDEWKDAEDDRRLRPDWLKARPVLYLLSHMAIMPLIDLALTGMEWMPGGGAAVGLWTFLALSFVNGCVLEIGRKLWTPQAEIERVDTYSRLWGPGRAALVWIGCVALSAALLILVGVMTGVGWTTAALALGAGRLRGRRFVLSLQSRGQGSGTDGHRVGPLGLFLLHHGGLPSALVEGACMDMIRNATRATDAAEVGDKAFFDHVEGSPASHVARRIRHAGVDTDPSRNPYLHWIMTGTHGDALPMAWRAEHYDTIRDRLDIRHGSLEAFVSTGERADGFNLSDIFEFMSQDAFRQVYGRILSAARPGARLIYWNMMTPRRVPADHASHVIKQTTPPRHSPVRPTARAASRSRTATRVSKAPPSSSLSRCLLRSSP